MIIMAVIIIKVLIFIAIEKQTFFLKTPGKEISGEVT